MKAILFILTFLCTLVACDHSNKNKQAKYSIKDVRTVTDEISEPEMPRPESYHKNDSITNFNTEDYDNIVENKFLTALTTPNPN